MNKLFLNVNIVCLQLSATQAIVLGSQKLFIIRLGVADVISAVTLYLLPALKRQNFYLVGYVSGHNNFACGLCLSIVAGSNDVSV